jgi:hypothetical protein
MSKLDYDYTQEDLYRRFINAVRGEPIESKEKGKKPIKIQELLAKTKLGKKQ